MQKTNDLIQWAGTVCILSMYAVMSFRTDLFPLNLMLGFAGSVLFLTWAVRTKNVPQACVNFVSLLICGAGVYSA
jgi:hypothetical protein